MGVSVFASLCVFVCNLGCSQESRDLSGLKVIPVSQNTERDKKKKKQEC